MKYTSCRWISHGLNFEPGHIEMCCLRCHVGGGNLFVKKPYNGEIINWDEFFELKQKFIEENKSGIINPKCEGCFNLQKADWDDEEHYFQYIHFNHWTHCNCKCIYCFTEYNKEYFNSQRFYNVLPVIKDMFAKNLFRPGGEITFAGGEPTILNEFDELIDTLIEGGAEKIIIHTSGIKYSEALARGIESGVVDAVVSMDSGSNAAYKKVKGYDFFERVAKNVRKYAQYDTGKKEYPLVTTKFIMMPNINDNTEEAEKWLRVSAEAGVKGIVLDIEHEWFKLQREKRAFPEHGREVLRYILNRAEELNLVVTLYNSGRYFLENEESFPGFDFTPYKYPSLEKAE